MKIGSSAPLDSIDPLAQYRFPEGSFDEMCLPAGQLRPHWEYLARSLQAMGPAELMRRSQDARHQLRDNGVTYNAYGDPQGQDRAWELDPIPLLITSEEWRSIEQGLVQRAELLRLLLADLYGSETVLQKGILPPELIYSHSGFLRPCYSMQAPHGRYQLPLYTADLARMPDGSLCVIGDRSQTSPGAGYALENRIVLSRVLPSLFRDSQVHRLALYFRTLRTTLMNIAWRDSDNTRIVVLSAGSRSETYFEHAYLAKYLGYTLVEGADLTVRDGRVWLKSLDGLQPVDVILRCVEDAYCDPLELRSNSFAGVAGLLQAARLRNVAIANPLGSGVLENSALKVFMPALAQHFLGEDLLLRSPQTYWCGFKQAREHVLAHLHRLVIKPTVRVPRRRHDLWPSTQQKRTERAASADLLTALSLCRPGSSAAGDHSRICRWCTGTPAVDTAQFSGGHRRGLHGDAGRPDPSVDGAGGSHRAGAEWRHQQGHLGACLGAGKAAHPGAARTGAQLCNKTGGAVQPGSGKPVLAGALCRTLGEYHSTAAGDISAIAGTRRRHVPAAKSHLSP